MATGVPPPEKEAGEPELLREMFSVALRPERDLRMAWADTGRPEGDAASGGGGEGVQAVPARSASNCAMISRQDWFIEALI